MQQARDQLAAREIAGRADEDDDLRKTRTDTSGNLCHDSAWHGRMTVGTRDSPNNVVSDGVAPA
jgi:hypothetical protein